MNLLRSKGVLLLVVMGICSLSALNVRQAMAYNNPFKISFFNTDENGEGGSGENPGESGDGESGEGSGESGEGSFEDKCKNAGYIYNAALIFKGPITQEFECTVGGELVVWGKTIISATFKKGEKYKATGEQYSCEGGDSYKGNCCNPTSQGIWFDEKPPLSPI